MKHFVAVFIILGALAGIHLSVLAAHGSYIVSAASNARVSSIPANLGDFRKYGPDDEVPASVTKTLQTNEILMRNYVSRQGRPVQLTVVLAGASRRSLHYPEVCLRGNGWEIREQTVMPVGIQFMARKLVLVKGVQKEAVIYWFKAGDRFTENFFVNSYYWALGKLTFEPIQPGMIRLSTMIGDEQDAEETAFQALSEFAQAVAPALHELDAPSTGGAGSL